MDGGGGVGMSVKEKEMKRRFFRRTKRSQRSLDSSSPIPSHSPSLENNSMIALGVTSSSSSSSAAAAAAAAAAIASSSSSTSIGGGGVTSRAFGAAGESNSLDETVINNRRMDHQHRRFMAAPRRARSAERFDGMRVAFNSPGDEMHPRNFRSPQLVRTAGGTSVTDLGRGVVVSGGSGGPGSGSQTPIGGPMPSPPPPYASAVTDITGPPSYRQAVAAMTAQAQGGKTNHHHQLLQQQPHHPTTHHHHHNNATTGNRYTMPHRGGTQSFDNPGVVGGGGLSSSGSGSTTPMTTGLRSAASVPAFTDDIICNCSKCQVLRRPNEIGYGDYNDAVYMESQAFLMHEIMTDGMAFCSIM